MTWLWETEINNIHKFHTKSVYTTLGNSFMLCKEKNSCTYCHGHICQIIDLTTRHPLHMVAILPAGPLCLRDHWEQNTNKFEELPQIHRCCLMANPNLWQSLWAAEVISGALQSNHTEHAFCLKYLIAGSYEVSKNWDQKMQDNHRCCFCTSRQTNHPQGSTLPSSIATALINRECQHPRLSD